MAAATAKTIIFEIAAFIPKVAKAAGESFNATNLRPQRLRRIAKIPIAQSAKTTATKTK